MAKKLNKLIATSLFCGSIISTAASSASALTIMLDPGHGGASPGCVYTYDSEEFREKDLNLTLALILKEKLEKYDNIKVVLTRSGDETISLVDRAEIAKRNKANVLISLHFNAHAVGKTTNEGGSIVIATQSHHNAQIYDTSHKLARCIIDKIKSVCGIEPYTPSTETKLPEDFDKSKITLEDGILTRESADHSYTPEFKADYYGIIRLLIEKGIPSIIIEHCYLSSETDFKNHIKSEESLQKFAEADAQAITETFGLKLKPQPETVA